MSLAGWDVAEDLYYDKDATFWTEPIYGVRVVARTHV